MQYPRVFRANVLEGKRPHLLRSVSFFIVFLASVFGAFFGLLAARGDFVEPKNPLVGFPPPVTTSGEFQIVGGSLNVQDAYVQSLGRWISYGPQVRVVKELTLPGGASSTAYCPSNEYLIGCTGSREENAVDDCAEENCGLIGVVPVDPAGNVLISDLNTGNTKGFGCMLGRDPNLSEKGVVHAYCLKN